MIIILTLAYMVNELARELKEMRMKFKSEEAAHQISWNVALNAVNREEQLKKAFENVNNERIILRMVFKNSLTRMRHSALFMGKLRKSSY